MSTKAPAAVGSALDPIVALCKRRGFVYPASEIYGGINGFWDYGPLGVLLKNNVRDWWWRHMVETPPVGPDGDVLQIVGLDSSIIQNPKTWEASGHVGGFSDPMRKCTKCGHFVRGDHLFDIIVASSNWFNSLIQTFQPSLEGTRTPGFDAPSLMKWAKGKGRKLAPNLALVRNPEVTMAWLAQRVNGQPGVPMEIHEIIRYAATEQLHADGLQEPCPLCGGEMGEPQEIGLMFESHAGITKSDENRVYLRPETAQGIFLNYKNVIDTTRVKVPFGIAQVGKSFRNELTPRNFIFRSREFEQMEMEWFCAPEEAAKWYDFWKNQRMNWWRSLGVDESRLRLRDHEPDELSHYSKMTVDIEYQYPFTAPDFGELEGIAHRGQFDLEQHQKHSGAKLEYFDQERNQKYLPNVIEPASGLTRAVLVLLCEAYTPDETRPSKVFMKFDPKFAPIKIGVFPLVNKDGMPERAVEIYKDLRQTHTCEYDPKQSIGKRYARMDEVGTPFCVTVDGETLTDGTVTVRHRDSQQQERVSQDKLRSFFADKMGR